MPTEKQVVEALREIIDPHSNISVYDMGLIHDLKVAKDRVSLTFRPTSEYCPLGVHLAMNIKRRMMRLKGVKKADVRVTGHVQEDQINKAMADM